MIFVIRYGGPLDHQRMRELMDSLVQNTAYVRGARLEAAPLNTDCLTIVHYLFKQMKIAFPVNFIGDMPRRLVTYRYSLWKPMCIPLEAVRTGDLFFVTNKKRAISHLGVFLDPERVFDCNKFVGTAVIHSYENFCNCYQQRLGMIEALTYVDPRNP
jgi:hypothetical protein